MLMGCLSPTVKLNTLGDVPAVKAAFDMIGVLALNSLGNSTVMYLIALTDAPWELMTCSWLILKLRVPGSSGRPVKA